MIFPFERVHEGTHFRQKDREKARIFRVISDRTAVTRKQIAELLGSRPTTVSNVVQELIGDRLVIEGEVREPGRQGRPELYLHPNPSRLVALSLYIVSREIKGAIVGLDGGRIASASMEIEPQADNRVVSDTIVALVDELLAKRPTGCELLGVGLSLTGGVDLDARRWLHTARFDNLSDLDLGSIERRIGLPVLPNRFVDSRLEYLVLTKPEIASGASLFLHWGYGIGAAYALNGAVLKGALGSFAELGHWRVAAVPPRPCLCGGSGCLESVAALWALSDELAVRYGPVPEDEAAFSEYFRLHALDRDELVTAARGWVAGCLANLFMTLFPDRLLLSGPFTASQESCELLGEAVERLLPPFARRRLSMRLLPVDFEADMIGTIHRLFRGALRPLLTAGTAKTAGPELCSGEQLAAADAALHGTRGADN